MNIGKLDNYVTILYPTEVLDATGFPKAGFLELTKAWAGFVGKPGREVDENGKLTGNANGEFTMRYDSRITVTNIILHNNAFWEVKSVSVIGRNEALTVMVEAKANPVLVPLATGGYYLVTPDATGVLTP